ncbi:hypothetical protein [Fodinibius saliphilus]|uniref:hypothetical protein n=1 Tax=Fodinibius saliphilus TaxID=1920650 RepID=UPI0011082F97|nr:hypothetical protein [Fodinibius saliphilus]
MKAGKFLSVILTAVLFIGLTDTLKAQQKEIAMNQIPKQVVVAIQSDFPGWNINKTKWYLDSEETQEWAPQLTNINRYIVKGKGNNYRVHAVYNKNGKLLYSKTIGKKIPLPKAIRDKIAKDEAFAGWTITGDKEVMRNFREDKKTYTVYFKRDGKKMSQRFDWNGKKLKKRILGK